jgi:hypothetical protein
MSEQAELETLIELLEVEPIAVRASRYQGVELVLDWAPAYKVITVVRAAGKLYCYSKQQFLGARYDGLGTWELTI